MDSSKNYSRNSPKGSSSDVSRDPIRYAFSNLPSLFYRDQQYSQVTLPRFLSEIDPVNPSEISTRISAEAPARIPPGNSLQRFLQEFHQGNILICFSLLRNFFKVSQGYASRETCMIFFRVFCQDSPKDSFRNSFRDSSIKPNRDLFIKISRVSSRNSQEMYSGIFQLNSRGKEFLEACKKWRNLVE